MSEKEVWTLLKELPTPHDISMLSDGNQASWLETNLYMQNQLLRDSDVMSMAHGIEIRVPFLDREFMQLVMSVQSNIKYTGMPKQLLINSFKAELPEPVWNRHKMGFTFPFSEWMAENELVQEMAVSQGAKGQVNYQRFLKGQLHWSQLMSLLLLNQHSFAA